MGKSRIKSAESTSTPGSNDTNPELFDYVEKDISKKIDDRFATIQGEIENKVNQAIEITKTDVLDNINAAKQELNDVKASVIEAIALIGVFFTFVSVNINIFSKQMPPFDCLGILIVFGILLFVFLHGFFMFLEKRSTDYRSWLPIGIGIVLSLIVMGFVSKNIQDYNSNRPDINQQSTATASGPQALTPR